MTTDELNTIVAAVVAELEKSGVDFDYKAEPAEDGDLVFVIRGTAPNYQGVTVTWKGLLDIITAQATQAKNDAETAKNAANTILEQVQSKGTEITNFVVTSKTEIETQKNESVNAVKSVYQTDLDELKGDLGKLYYTWYDNAIPNRYTGEIISESGVSYAELDVSVFSGLKIYGHTRMGNSGSICFYNKYGDFISSHINESGNYDYDYDVDIPQNATMARITCSTSYKNVFTVGVKDILSLLKKHKDYLDSLDNDVFNKVDILSKNIFNGNDVLYNSIYSSDGNVVENNYWSLSGLIDVSKHNGEKIICNKWASSSIRYSCFFKENGEKIPISMEEQAITIPDGAKNCRIAIYQYGGIYPDNIQIEINDVSTSYERYNPISGYLKNYDCLEYEVPKVNGLSGNNVDFNVNSSTKLQDIYDWYDELVSVFPSNFTRVQIGTTTTPTNGYEIIDSNTYPIYAYEYVGNNADDNNKFIIAGGIHGDEQGGDGIQGVCACAYFVKDMLCNAKNEYLKFMKNNCKIIIIPVINPWGYQNGRRCNGRGVDLNRNFDYNFKVGTSYGYSTGDSAFSENESSAFRDYISNHTDSKFMCEIHTRGGDVLPNDGRWFIILNGERTTNSLYETLKKCCNKMIDYYGGLLNISKDTGSNLVATCFTWVDKILDIPSYEPEFFKSCNMDIKTLNKQVIMIQCTHFMGIMIQSLVNQFMDI